MTEASTRTRPDHKYEFDLRIISNPCCLCLVRSMLETLMDRLEVDSRTCGMVVLAVDEALANVIRHGYDNRQDQSIWIKVHASSTGYAQRTTTCRIVIEDEGKQVDPKQVCGRDLSDVRPGGLGVHLIHHIMDEVELVPRETGRGMRLTMIKHLHRDDRTDNEQRTGEESSS